MRQSTANALAEATRRCKSHGITVKPAGFKYHSERIWLGVAENDDLILVEVPVVFKESNPEELHVFVYSTKNSRELDMVPGDNKPATTNSSPKVDKKLKKTNTA